MQAAPEINRQVLVDFMLVLNFVRPRAWNFRNRVPSLGLGDKAAQADFIFLRFGALPDAVVLMVRVVNRGGLVDGTVDVLDLNPFHRLPESVLYLFQDVGHELVALEAGLDGLGDLDRPVALHGQVALGVVHARAHLCQVLLGLLVYAGVK